MMAESPPPSPPTLTADEFLPLLESLLRISLAGIGGALAGLSLSRRSAVSRAVTSSADAIQRKHVIHRHAPISRLGSLHDQELPGAWATACMAFAGVVEFSRLVSPWDILCQLAATTEEAPFVTISGAFDAPIRIVSNYTIGGSVAGMIFRGSAVRTRLGARMDASLLGSVTGTGSLLARPLSGMIPGATLGFLAGATVVLMDYFRDFLETEFTESTDSVEEDQKEDGQQSKIEGGVPADIKAMSNTELQREIDQLLRRRDESGRT